MSHKTDRMFELAKKVALKNLDDKNNHHLGAVLVKGGAVVSTGANIPRSNRLIRYIAEKYGDRPLNIHSEVNAMLGVPTSKSRGGVIYVARVKQHADGSCHYRLAKPCEHCQEFARKRGIKKIYYSIGGIDTIKEWGVVKI